MPDLSLGTQVTALDPYRIVMRGGAARIATGGGADWFGPLDPLAPLAPPAVAGRQFDYPPGFNLLTHPRGYEPIGFAALRALADGYDLLRVVIETRKDQMARLEWNVRARSGGRDAGDPRVAAITAFFARPDGANAWDTWLRELLEDLFVIDAPTLWAERTRGGGLMHLHPIDGATIKRVIDDGGRTPRPPLPAYQQVLHGLPAVDYTTRDIIYRPRNTRVHRVYGFSPVEQIIITVNIALRRQVFQLQYYTEGNIPEALIGTPDAWTPEQIERFQLYWDSLNAGNTAERRHAKFVPGGVARTFLPTKEPELTGATDEWLARLCCFAFSVSPQPFVRMMNRATAQDAQEQALAEGLAPIRQWVKQLADFIIADEFGAGDLEFRWRDDPPADPTKAAAIAGDYVKAGIKSVNEVRRELGLDPVPGGDQPTVLTAQGPVKLGAAVPVAKAERFFRFNPNHYGPGPRGSQFAPNAGGDGGTAMTPASGDDGRAAGAKPWVGQPHAAFRAKIAEAERSADKPGDGYGEYNKDGSYGPALGRYQLTPAALEEAGWMDAQGHWNPDTGVTSNEQFLDDPDAQECAMTDVLATYEPQIASLNLDAYIGQSYRGLLAAITVTEAGLVAASHRAGAPQVAGYLAALQARGWTDEGAMLSPDEKSVETRLRIFQDVPY